MIRNILFKMININKIYWILIFIVFNLILDNYRKNKSIYKYINNGINTTPSNYSCEKSSRSFWENKYAKGGNSGPGSYNRLARFKASVLNYFVIKNHINTVIEFGSGDCNQLSLANYKNYIGYDVSQTAVKICQKKFNNDKTKTFIYMGDNFPKDKKADLSMSLDVLYHILEDNVFNSYMINLFNSSNKYVCIYSSNVEKPWAKHVRHRKFTDWIKKYIPNEWKLKQYIPNKYPFDIRKPDSTSLADFFFYEKVKI